MAVSMDDESRANIEAMDKIQRFPTGIGRIDRGECPMGAVSPVTCTFCEFGHMMECHHPYTCEEAECGHWQQALLE